MPIEGEARASSEIIARGVEQQHASVIKLIRRYEKRFERFGKIRFEIRARRSGQHGGGDVDLRMRMTVRRH
ncbi:conserved hypothetical protein [Burkholderia cenocepacia J2315]|uniref:Uncharacterized protein n=1 Tax=Burkholderia cenocepacia (strain ATCC BAA-245 / DSM 16553 / LMG 16656 / NCTC 13227 / J2315 / CF5610) TaxID=216591 RepID=B4EB70_BURCJ|nr:conserved hypothetical protein [Burkholderia cenocepacia J2315]